MTLKINLKTQLIEEAGCDGLLSIKDNIRIFDSGYIQFRRNFTLWLVVNLKDGTNLFLFFCPFCGEKLESKFSLKEIHAQLFQE